VKEGHRGAKSTIDNLIRPNKNKFAFSPQDVSPLFSFSRKDPLEACKLICSSSCYLTLYAG
jgi:hypothetical protein